MQRTKYQEGIIKNYYNNRDHIMMQKLSEIVSELWLAPNAAKKKKLWARAEQALQKLEVKPEVIARILEEQDEKELAKFVNGKF